MNEMVEAIVSQLIPTLSNSHTHMEIIIAVMTLVEKYASMSGKEKESLAINAIEAITICAGISKEEREILRLLLATPNVK